MPPIEIRNIDDRFIIHLRREEYYTCPNYISPSQIKLQEPSLSSDYTHSLPSATSLMLRHKICAWNFQVIDHCELDRELAFISLNYLDRYLSCTSVNKETFQLAAMTSLFLAIKVYSSGTLKVSSLVEMSRGHFQKEHIISMENSILWALSWSVHPPTPLSFIRNCMPLLEESGCSPVIADKIEDLAKFLTELSVGDYYFATHKSSSTGLGALLVALVSTDIPTLSLTVRQNFLKRMQLVSGMDSSSEEIQECKHRLNDIYLFNTEPQQMQDEVNFPSSPDCVSNVV